MRKTFSIEAALASRGWTTAHLAAAMADRKAPVSVRTVERWLEGRTIPAGDMVPVIADALGVEMGELYIESPDEDPAPALAVGAR
jgi:transcriptional regulator with XRE-family HTH domain